MRPNFVAVLLLVALSACATAAPPPVTMIDYTSAQMTLPGIASNDTVAIKNEAAKVANNLGFRYFKIVSALDETRISTVYVPPPTSAARAGFAPPAAGSFGSIGLGAPPAPTVVTLGTTVVIKMMRPSEVASNAPDVCDVVAILASTPNAQGTTAATAPPVSPPPTLRATN